MYWDISVGGGYGICYAYLFRFGRRGLLAYNGPDNYAATLTSKQRSSQGLCTSRTQDPATLRPLHSIQLPNEFRRADELLDDQGADALLAEALKTAYVQAFHVSVQDELPLHLTL